MLKLCSVLGEHFERVISIPFPEMMPTPAKPQSARCDRNVVPKSSGCGSTCYLPKKKEKF